MSILNKHIDIKFTTKEQWLPTIQQLFPYEINKDKFEVKNNILYLYNSNSYGMKILINEDTLDALDKTGIDIIKIETNTFIEDLYYEVVICVNLTCLNKFKEQLTIKYNNKEKVTYKFI